MTAYTYDPSSGNYIGNGTGTVVGVNDILGTDSITFGAPLPGAPKVPYTVTLPQNLTAGSIIIGSPLATIVVPNGGVLNAAVSVNNGAFDVGTSGSTATTTVNGTVAIAGGNVTVNGTVSFVSPTGVPTIFIPGTSNGFLTLTAGANVTSSDQVNSNVPSSVDLGAGSTLAINTDLTGFQAWSTVRGVTGSGTLRFASIDNTDNTLDFTQHYLGQANLTFEARSISGGTVRLNANTTLAGTVLVNVNVVGDISMPSFSGGQPANTLVNPTGTGIVSVPGPTILSGRQDPLTYDVFGGSITGFDPLTFAPGTVVNVTPSSFSFGSMTFFSQTAFQGTLHVSAPYGAASYTITAYAPLQFSVGGAVEIDPGATLEINAIEAAPNGFDNETTIQLAGGTLQLDRSPTTLGTIQFYTGNSTLQLGSSALSTSFAASGTLRDFSDSDAVIFNGATFGANAQATLSGTTLSVVDQNGTSYGTFVLSRDDAQTYVQSDFTLAAVSGGMELTTHGVTVLAAPVVTGDTSYTVHNFFAPGPAIPADLNIAVSDPGSTTLVGATVAITSNFVAGDVLGLVNQNGIVGSYNAATGILALTGTATLAQYKQALDSVTYGFTPGGDPTLGSGVQERILSWSVNDGKVASTPRRNWRLGSGR